MTMEDFGGVNASRAASLLLQTAAPIAAAAIIIGIMTVVLPRSAIATPAFAAKTGLQCSRCHVSPGGGGKLKPFGEAFKANGFNVPKKKK